MRRSRPRPAAESGLSTSWRQRRVPPLAGFLVVVGALLVFNLSNWRYLRLLEESKARDLVERLQATAVTASLGIVNPSPPMVLLRVADALDSGIIDANGDTTTDTVEELSEEDFDRIDFVTGPIVREEMSDPTAREIMFSRLLNLQRSAGLADVALLTTSGLVIMESSSPNAVGDPYRFRDLDADVVRKALEGRPAATALYPIGGELFMRLYAPVRISGIPVGLLVVSLSPGYQEEIAELRQSVVRQWLISSVLLLLLGLFLWRLFSYVVKVEEQAMQGARVDAMGALAGAVAHELRNPLSIIRALAEETGSGHDPLSREALNARDIVAETDRLNEIVSHFLSLAKSPEAGDSRVIEMGSEISRVLELLQKSSRDAGSLVRLDADLPEEPVFVRGDERAVRQVLLNLLLNAREATESNGAAGKVTVTLREKRGHAELKISDNGPGFDRRTLTRAFEPFYTTKPMGTGLGLALTRGIVQNLGGEILLGNGAGGRGAEVVVLLPIASQIAGIDAPKL